jgi:hypothetical protein
MSTDRSPARRLRRPRARTVVLLLAVLGSLATAATLLAPSANATTIN